MVTLLLLAVASLVCGVAAIALFVMGHLVAGGVVLVVAVFLGLLAMIAYVDYTDST